MFSVQQLNSKVQSCKGLFALVANRFHMNRIEKKQNELDFKMRFGKRGKRLFHIFVNLHILDY